MAFRKKHFYLLAAFLAGGLTDIILGNIYASLWGLLDPQGLISDKIFQIEWMRRIAWVFDTIIISIFDLFVYLLVNKYYKPYARAFGLGILCSILFACIDFTFLDESTRIGRDVACLLESLQTR